jgi:hypothetical protein
VTGYVKITDYLNSATHPATKSNGISYQKISPHDHTHWDIQNQLEFWTTFNKNI